MESELHWNNTINLRENMQDTAVNAVGDVHILLDDGMGDVRNYHFKNLVVTLGLQFIAQSLIKTTNSPVAMTHMGIGSDATAAATAQSALLNQLIRKSLIGATNVAGTLGNDTVQYQATFAPGEGTSTQVQEAGLFNASTAGTMLSRVVFGAINKQAADSMTITWKIRFAAGV